MVCLTQLTAHSAIVGRSTGMRWPQEFAVAILLAICVARCHPSRAVARTILDEVLGVRPDYIEHQLAHSVRDPMVAPTTEPRTYPSD